MRMNSPKRSLRAEALLDAIGPLTLRRMGATTALLRFVTFVLLVGATLRAWDCPIDVIWARGCDDVINCLLTRASHLLLGHHAAP